MINLMKNEFIKIFKKKSTYIILIITLGFIILSNFLYKNTNTENFSGYSSEMLSFYEEDLKSLDVNDSSTQMAYIETKVQVDMLRLIDKYGYNSWQANVIQEKLSTYISTINYYEYSSEKDENSYKEAKLKYNDIVSKLDSGDWRYFALSDLNDIESQINTQKQLQNGTIDTITLNSIKSNLHDLEIKKQVLQWRLEKDISYESSFLNNCLEKYSNYGNMIYSYEHSDNHSYSEKQDYFKSLEQFNTSKYYIENNIKNINNNDNRDILLNLFSNYELFILIFVIMIAGSIVSDEFSKGTIKLLLVRPYSRTKIILAKFIVCVLILLLFISFVAVSQFLIGGLIQGFDNVNIPAIIYNFDTNSVETINIAQYILITAIAKLPIYLLLMTLAFACSAIFTNTAIAIVIPLLGYMGSSLINMLATAYDIKLLLYFVTPNWDLTDYLFGGLPMFESLTIPFSIAICVAYFIIMMVTTLVVFKKRNIKNI